MASIASLVTVFAIGAVSAYFAISRRSIRLERESHIRHFTFSAPLLHSLQNTYPHLEEKDLFLVARALRQYFLIHAKVPNRTIGMPSQVVDTLWHNFILDTKNYQTFCIKAFGGFFHHIPAENASEKANGNRAMKLTWRNACLEENIDPKNATRLPLLFAIDSKLKIPDGFVYDLEMLKKSAPNDSNSSCSGFGCSGGGDCSSGCSGGCSGD